MLIGDAFKHLFRFGLVILVVDLTLLVHKVTSLNCYICGSPDEIECNYFNVVNATLFKKECPPESKSCGTEILGSIVLSRSCEDLELNDCKVANNVEYCYCNTDLCNGIVESFKSVNRRVQEPSDDEDFDEGSGFTTVSFASPKFTFPTTTIAGISTSSPMEKLQNSAQLPVSHFCIAPTVVLSIVKVVYL